LGSVKAIWSRLRRSSLTLLAIGGIAAVTTGCFPNLTMFEGSDPTVWVVRDGKSWGVPTGEMVDCLGGWSAVRHVTDAERDAMRAFNPYGGAASCTLPSRLYAYHQLAGSQSLRSPNGRYVLSMQTDGNLVLYADGQALWASWTQNNPGAWVVMQGDGNL